MYILSIIIWLLLGIIAVWREYHGVLKYWYVRYNESYWNFHKKNNLSSLGLLIMLSPIFILFGLVSLIILELTNPDSCWWFTTKNK
jgi:uncharacterized membrane protein